MRPLLHVLLTAMIGLACAPVLSPVVSQPAIERPNMALDDTSPTLSAAAAETPDASALQSPGGAVADVTERSGQAGSTELDAFAAAGTASAIESEAASPTDVALLEPTLDADDPGTEISATMEEAPIALATETTAEPIEESCEPRDPEPLPRPGDPGAAGFWGEFRSPLPAAELWNPPGPRRVGLQAGHWLNEEAPAELENLQHGTSGGGKAEWEVTLDLAQRTKALLEQAGVEVDLLPATVPVSYRAHVFVSIHADGDASGQLSGFKVARPGFSSIPEVDNRLVAALYAAYEPATGLARDDEHVSRRMLYYYAFNSRRYCHAVSPGVPQAIIETGFLTNEADRAVLLDNPDAPARGIAEGILAFLGQ